jgi:hypothetical protein
MARKSKQDVAKEKAAKQKKIAIVGGVLFVALLAFQGPKTLKMLHPHPVAAPPPAATTTPTVTPADPNTLAAPTLAGAPVDTTQTSTTSSELVSAVPMSVDPGQLKTFEQFASKDPFAAKAPGSTPPAGAGGSSKPQPGGGTTTTSPPASQSTPPPPSAGSGGSASAPGTAVISVNGELMSVSLGTDFPTSGTLYSRSGALFHLVSLTGSTAKIAIAGGSYADGAATVTLQVKKALTLQNTADGTKYTLILEPAGTALPAGSAPAGSVPATAPAATVPTSTTPASAVPPTSGATG